jgi:hypothetical protein
VGGRGGVMLALLALGCATTRPPAVHDAPAVDGGRINWACGEDGHWHASPPEGRAIDLGPVTCRVDDEGRPILEGVDGPYRGEDTDDGE